VRLLSAFSAAVVAGSVLAIVDMARRNACGDRATWLGYSGWTLIVVASLATAAALTVELRARRWAAIVPAAVALSALLAAIGYAEVQSSLDSLCGFELQL
jgi:hypothetical protein